MQTMTTIIHYRTLLGLLKALSVTFLCFAMECFSLAVVRGANE